MEIVAELNQDFEIGGKNSIKWLENAMLNASIGFKLRLQHGLMLEAYEYLGAYQKFLNRYQSLNDVFGDVTIKSDRYQSALKEMHENIKAVGNATRQRMNIVAL